MWSIWHCTRSSTGHLLKNNLKVCLIAHTQLTNKIFLTTRNINTKLSFRTNEAENTKGISPFGWFLMLIPVTTFGLGYWQVQRKKWKEHLIKELAARVSLPPVPLPEDLTELSAMEFNSVIVKGTFLHNQSVLMGPRSLLRDGDAASQGGLMSHGGNDSTTGYHVITPFMLTDRNETIMINRGWIPANKRHSFCDTNIKIQREQLSEEVEIIGVVRHTEDRPPFSPSNNSNILLYRDIPVLSKLTGCTQPIFLDAKGTRMNPNDPIPNQTRASLRNEHLSYVITWFSLSAFTSVMWYTRFMKKLPLS